MNVLWPAPIRGAYHQGDASGGDWVGSLIPGMQDASGLLYKRNRYYNPQTGQFTQPDPIGIAGGLNTYGFAEGDPVSHADPFGLFKIEYGDRKVHMQVVKLRATSPLIAQDLDDMERHSDIFIIERAYIANDGAGVFWGAALDANDRVVYRVQMNPSGVRRLSLSPTVQANGGVTEGNVLAHEIHSHAGPAARGEDCDDVGHGPDTCGMRKENEWRAEQGLPQRTYSDVRDTPRGELPPIVKP